MLQRSLTQTKEDEEKLDAIGAQLRNEVRGHVCHIEENRVDKVDRVDMGFAMRRVQFFGDAWLDLDLEHLGRN